MNVCWLLELHIHFQLIHCFNFVFILIVFFSGRVTKKNSVRETELFTASRCAVLTKSSRPEPFVCLADLKQQWVLRDGAHKEKKQSKVCKQKVKEKFFLLVIYSEKTTQNSKTPITH